MNLKIMLACGTAIAGAGSAAAQTRDFAVPAMPAGKAVQIFARQAGVDIIAAGTSLKGVTTNAVKGKAEVPDALDRLLSGTKLKASRSSDDVYLIKTAARTKNVMLAALVEPAQGGSATDAGILTTQAEPVATADIVVTGSRLANTGFNTATPVSVFDADELANRSADNVASALNQLPQLRGSVLAGAVANTSAAFGTNGQNLLSMRNLGPPRTLVLLDGNRLPNTNNAGSTDINILPQSLIKRVDVVTGGASASYGSDAVAGVINFILDTRFEGLKGSVNAGITTYGDNASIHATLAHGRSFAGGQGRLIVSAEYLHEDRVGYSNHPNGRSWFDQPIGAYNNPVGGALPRVIVAPNLRKVGASVGGLITSGPLSGMQFGPGGTLTTFNGGATPTGQNTSGGDGPRAVAQITPEQWRGSLFLHGEYDFSDGLTGFVEGMFNRTKSTNISFPNYSYQSASQFTIFRDNAYLPTAVSAMFAANPSLASFTVGRFSDDITPITNIGETTLWRGATGVKGQLSDRWGFDANLMYSRVQQNLDRINIINRNLYAAADAVVNPANGQIVCRSTLAGRDPGCAPMNIFGPNAVSAAANDYVTGLNQGHTTIRQAAFNANVRGDLGDTLSLGAGPINLALGVAYRRENVQRVVDALSAINVDCTGVRGCPSAFNTGLVYGSYLSYNPAPLKGAIGVSEGYAEMGVPLLKDVRIGDFSIARELNLTLAGRATDYSLSGVAYSWKVGTSWQVDDDLRLRFTRSRDIRAPNASELFGSGNSAAAQVTLPASGAVFSGATYLVGYRGFAGVGNRDLQPEKGSTTTYGGVLKPSWLPGFQISLDYYRVKIADAIAAPLPPAVVDGCYLGNQQFCKLITLNSGTIPVTSTTQIPPNAVGLTIKTASLNIATQSTSGLDLAMNYQRPLGNGTITFSLLGNYLLSAYDSGLAASGATKLVGSLDYTISYPRWSGFLSVHYSGEAFSLFVQERLISKGTRNASFVEGVNISDNSVPMVAYTDITATYKLSALGAEDEIFFSVSNLFNKAPPATATSTSNSLTPTNYSLYDVIGRRFSLGFRFKL
jgi:iron complex outermembrane receptor protein